jgi:IclR family pca regulon transcriptional regulator
MEIEIMENLQEKSLRLIHTENKKIIRHEDFVAGISKGLVF